MGDRVPQHVQNLVIRDYCERKNLHFLLSSTEYSMKGSQLILEQALCELSEIDGLAAYSLYQLPEDVNKRKRVYDKILTYKKSIHFAVEGLSAKTQLDCEKIESLWRIRQFLPKCLNGLG